MPKTLVQDFADWGAKSWAPVPVPLEFPVIAKAASSAEYEELEFEGKHKVFTLSDEKELAQLWQRLGEAGFRGQFLVQDLVPGGDAGMHSVTAYVDSSGKVTMLCSARVLLEEHTPSGLGNAAAMYTDALPEIAEPAREFLEAVGYRGFAHLDVKWDPRDGVFKFLELNPRIGRNNYHVTAAGLNPAEFVVRDLLHGESVPPRTSRDRVLYTVIPLALLSYYTTDPELKRKVRSLQRRGRVVRPLSNPVEHGLRRKAYVAAASMNQVRKFLTNYPRPRSD